MPGNRSRLGCGILLNTEQLAATAFLPIALVDEMIRSGRLTPTVVSLGVSLFDYSVAQSLVSQQRSMRNSLLWVADDLQMAPETILAWATLGLVTPLKTREGYLGFGEKSHRQLERLRNLALGMDARGGGKEVLLYIGDVAQLLGVSPHTIRAWERRHQIVQPRRSPAGQRLYTVGDVERLRRFRASRLSLDASALGLASLLPATVEEGVGPRAFAGD